MESRLSISWLAGSVYDSVSKSASVTGYTRTCRSMAGPPAALARRARTAAMFPPALAEPGTGAKAPPTAVDVAAPAARVLGGAAAATQDPPAVDGSLDVLAG